jgi:hypothetical protein
MKANRPSRLRRLLKALIVLAILAVILFFSLPLFFAPARVAPADAILHLAIDSRSHGNEYVAKLYRDGVAKTIICATTQVSWEVYPADFARQHLIHLGIPAADVSAMRLPILECGAEYRPIFASYLKERGWRRVIFVVNPTLTRLGRWRAEGYFRDAGIEATFTFVPEDRAEMLDAWWRTHWKAQYVVLALMNSSLDLLYARCR